jgi:hypothetical protein
MVARTVDNGGWTEASESLTWSLGCRVKHCKSGCRVRYGVHKSNIIQDPLALFLVEFFYYCYILVCT